MILLAAVCEVFRPNSLITDSAAGMGVETEVGDALAGERLEVLGKIVLEAEKSHL